MGGKAMSREQLLQTAFAVARLGHRMNDGSYLGLRCAWNAFRYAGEMLEQFLTDDDQQTNPPARFSGMPAQFARRVNNE